MLHILGHWRPELLVLFATLPSDMPAARKLIDYLRDVNAQSGLQVMCCGGIYKRAEGLAEEIGADLFADDADDAVRIARHFPQKRATAEQQTVGRKRRARKALEKRSRAGAKSSRAVSSEIDPQREAACVFPADGRSWLQSRGFGKHGSRASLDRRGSWTRHLQRGLKRPLQLWFVPRLVEKLLQPRHLLLARCRRAADHRA